ncbi:hypothetical protein GGD62_008207 [Bradyrhizobium sp. ERR14]|nr:hypothetical protein [Bradyrhizobium sp. ERR14]
MAGRKPHPHITRYGNHRRSSTSRTRASASGSTCASTRMRRRLPRSISINPIRAATTAQKMVRPAGMSALVDARQTPGWPLLRCDAQPQSPLHPAPTSPRQSVPCHPATIAADAPARPKPRPASPDDLQARLKVTRLANCSVSDKTAPAGCVRFNLLETRSRRPERSAPAQQSAGHQGIRMADFETISRVRISDRC